MAQFEARLFKTVDAVVWGQAVRRVRFSYMPVTYQLHTSYMGDVCLNHYYIGLLKLL